MDIIIQTLYEYKKKMVFLAGQKSLQGLKVFIDGYIFRQMQIDPEFTSVFFGFDDYIAKYWEMNGKYSWDRILLAFSRSDEEAFDNFYQHLDEYLSDKERLVKVQKTLDEWK